MRANEKLHEECGVFGVSVSMEEAAGITYNGLLAMQHRGQEGAGIAVSRGNKILYHKDRGLVSEVFTRDVMEKMPASRMAIGHVRYSTSGADTLDNVQPFINDWMTGRIATVHNGNVRNAEEIRDHLQFFGVNFDATSDSEIIASLIAYKTMQLGGDILHGAVEACKKLVGAYSLLIMSGDHKIIALRDPNGYRPLCLGKNEYGVCVASETCALDSCGFTFLRDIEPGEVVVIEDGQITHSETFTVGRQEGLCIFEYVYFARSDSVIDGQSVYEARLNMGKILAREYPVDADVVCGAPDSGLDAAAGYSIESGIPLVTGFVKNRYIGRSFIFPSQAQRKNAVKMKLNPLRPAVEGKRVVLVDDSIVRGTTSDLIIANLRHAGATEVHVRISSPPFLHSCYYGTDVAEEGQLIANQLSIEEICRKIGADSLGYISIEGLKEACRGSRRQFCTGCFNGEYWQDKKSLII
ncbi:MAG: amidophosphoribosyltransferase [Lachnospiraceae bacterium]|nr:amidophosphoribosyltransferase [Lachnospiraceae bacterium]